MADDPSTQNVLIHFMDYKKAEVNLQKTSSI